MSPESFNAALATRKLEAIDILLIQAKRGSDADRIRAAGAILRIASFPTVASASSRCSAQPTPPSPSQRGHTPSPAQQGSAGEGVRDVTSHATDVDHQIPQPEDLQESGGSRRQSPGPSRSAAAGAVRQPPPTPHGSDAQPRVSASTAPPAGLPDHTPVPSPASPSHPVTISPSHPHARSSA